MYSEKITRSGCYWVRYRMIVLEQSSNLVKSLRVPRRVQRGNNHTTIFFATRTVNELDSFRTILYNNTHMTDGLTSLGGPNK